MLDFLHLFFLLKMLCSSVCGSYYIVYIYLLFCNNLLSYIDVAFNNFKSRDLSHSIHLQPSNFVADFKSMSANWSMLQITNSILLNKFTCKLDN